MECKTNFMFSFCKYVNFSQEDFYVLELVELKCTVFYAMDLYKCEYGCLQKIIPVEFFMNEMSTLYYFQRERQSEGGKKRKGEGRGGENERERTERQRERDSNMTSHEII